MERSRIRRGYLGEGGGGWLYCHHGNRGFTSVVFQSNSSTFFMGKWGAFMLQNLVTMVKRSRAKGSPLYRGDAEGQRSD